MELGETITFSIHNDDCCSIRNVNANFDNSGRNEDIYFSTSKIGHNLVFFGWLHFAVQDADFGFFENCLEFLGLLFDGGKLSWVFLFNCRANPINLLFFGKNFTDLWIKVSGLVDFGENSSFNRFSSSWQLIDN